MIEPARAAAIVLAVVGFVLMKLQGSPPQASSVAINPEKAATTLPAKEVGVATSEGGPP